MTHIAYLASSLQPSAIPWRWVVLESLLLCIPALVVVTRARTPCRRSWGVIVVVALAARLLFLFVDPHLSDDCYRYLWDGRVQVAGFSPYGLPPNAAELADVEADWNIEQRIRDRVNHPDIPTIYPPVLQMAFRCVATVGGGLLAWRLLLLLVEVGLGLMLRGELRRRGLPQVWLLFYLWHPLPIFENVWSAHVEGIAVFWLVAAVLLLERNQNFRGATALALGAATKLLPLALFPWLLRWRGWRPLIVATVVGLSCIALYWPDDPARAVRGLNAYRQGWYFNDVLYQLLGGWLDIDVMDKTLASTQFLRNTLIGVFLLAVALSSWRQKDAVAVALATTLWFVICSTTVYPWYLIWVLPFAILRGAWPALALTYLILLSNVVQVEWFEGGSWRVPGEIRLLEFGLPATLLLWQLWRRRRPLLDRR